MSSIIVFLLILGNPLLLALTYKFHDFYWVWGLTNERIKN